MKNNLFKYKKYNLKLIIRRMSNKDVFLVKKANVTKFDFFKIYHFIHSESYKYFERLYIRKILKENYLKNKLSIDIGCGPGLVLNELCKIFDQCIGVDISCGMLDCAKKGLSDKYNMKVDLLCVDIDHMPFRTGLFDIVAMYSVLHHLPNLNQSLKEINRIMNSNSRFILFHEPNDKQLRLIYEKTLLKFLEKIRTFLYPILSRKKYIHYKQKKYKDF